ncbi:unnamed protein product [Angiostrongylus costaricensis]|uniref:EF-hand domain-containing protein n=1 Tax=Angiostrongylus costaricensis TaxID=334426 RepID=A0A0R3PDV7_ANGCS|nr:unnamed protein product [Angiostrongylus costaricensis]
MSVTRKMHYKVPNEMRYESEASSWVRLFRAFDVDHDGFIPTTDLKRSIREAAFSFGFDPEEVNAMTRNIDANGDRLIDFAEFCTLIAIYIYYTVESNKGLSITGPVPTKSVLIFNPYRKEELWRFITYMFIHIGLYHLVFNVLTQLLLGIPLELVHQWRVIVIYLAGVLSGW